MYITKYWEKKAELVQGAFKECNRKEELTIRKMIICAIMKIHERDIKYYLQNDIGFKKFALNDTSAIDETIMDDMIDKVQEVIKCYFYKRDYCLLCGIEDLPQEDVDKKQVCDKIMEMVKDDVYHTLNQERKQMVDILERVYFDPINLLNEHIKISAGSEVYYTILMEQWKTANEMAANISAQRNNMNNFYMSLMSILIGGILFSDQLLSTNDVAKTILFITISIMGVVCCNIWISQIENYGRLNGAKYDIINELERSLPANVMLCEYNRTENNARRTKRKINFSKQEKSIANLFRCMVVAVPILMLVGTWGDEIWNFIQNLIK